MGNSTLHRCAKEDGSSARCPSVIQDADDVDNYYHGDENDGDEDDDGMFHGVFCLGSKVLTEVELESPVEESKIIATPIRTPKKSNNSSHASSTRELDFGSPHVCFHVSGSCSSTDAMTVVSACQRPTPSGTSLVCRKASSVPMCPSPSHAQMDHYLSAVCSREGREDERIICSESAPLYRSKCRGFSPDEYIPRLPFWKERNKRHNEGSLEPSWPSADGELFAHSKVGDDESCKIMGGAFSAECSPVNALLEQGTGALASTCKAGGSCEAAPEGLQSETPTSSPPDSSKSTLLGRGRDSQDNCRRPARSLTDKDFDELRGCIDLGFVFMKDSIPELCGTLPALEVCYAIEQGPVLPFDIVEDRSLFTPESPPISPWKVAGPGDQPHQVKERLRHWAQAVACNVRQGC